MKAGAVRRGGRKQAWRVRAGVSALALGVVVSAPVAAIEKIDDGSVVKAPEHHPDGWDVGDNLLHIGDSSGGRLGVNANGFVYNIGFAQIGVSETGVGVLTVEGDEATVAVNRDVNVGIKGSGELHIGAGGFLITRGRAGSIGNQATGTGLATVSGTGARWQSEGRLDIGREGAGVLTIGDGGLVSVGRGLRLGVEAGSSGVLNLNVGGALLVGGNLSAGAGAAHFNLAGGELRVMGSGLNSNLDMLLSQTSIVDTNGFDARFSGELNGTGGLNKTGAGTLTLSGLAGYSGQTIVSGGTLIVGAGSQLLSSTVVGHGATLQVDGQVTADTRVDAGGTLSGNGYLHPTTIAAGGILAPGGSIGVLKILAGNLTFEPGSFYHVDVDPASGASDRVVAGGAAYLGGTVVHTGLVGPYQPSSTYRILTAAVIHGAFEGVISNYQFLTPELLYVDLPDTTRAVDLRLARNNIGFADVGGTRNQVATARGVDSLGAGHPVYDAIVQMPDDTGRIQRGYDALSGEVHASLRSALVSGSHVLRDTANSRLRAVFSGVGAGYAPIRVASAGSLAGIAPRSGLGLWASSFGSWSRQDGDHNAATLRQHTAGFLAGADRPIGDWRIGALAGYSHASIDVDDRASSGKGDSYHLGVYGGRRLGALGLHGGLNHTWHQLDTRRSVTVGGLSERLTADYSARTLQAYGELSYGIEFDAVSVEPYANLAHVRLHIDGYTEQGGAAALSSRSQAADMTYVTLGMRLSKDFALAKGEAAVYGALGWRRELDHVQPSVTHAFVGGDPFTVTGAPIAQDAAVIEAGLDLRLSDTVVLGASYSGQLASGAQDHGVTARLHVAF